MKVEEDFFAKVEEDCLMNVEGDCSAVKVEGDSSLRCSGQKLKRESDVLQNPEKCCRLTPKNILSYLPDDLIGRILFSGYLNKLWYNTICLVLVCKKFKEVGRTYIAYIKSTHMITMDAETLKTTELEVLGIGRIAPNLVYLDLSFCKIIQFDGDAGAMLLTLRHTLRGLSLRGTKVDDAFLGAYISQLSGLRFLDISKKKSMDKELVTDLGVLPLVYLKNLKWLNLSMCNITDMSISALCASVLHMEHIALFSCRALTDASLKVISTWKLHTLDISNCAKLTLSGLSFLINPRYAQFILAFFPVYCSVNCPRTVWYAVCIPCTSSVPTLLCSTCNCSS